MAGNRPTAGAPRAGLSDNAPRPGVLYEFDIPDKDGLWSEVTKDFGSVRTVGLRLLTPLQEKHAAQAAKGDPIMLAFELGRRALAEITNADGQTFALAEHDGSSNSAWSQMHPRIRTLVMKANAEISVPNEDTQDAFLASRRIRA